MSSYTEQASNAASNTAGSALYGKQRAEQEAGNLSSTASATTNAYADQANSVAASATDTAQQYVAAAGQTLSDARDQTTRAVNDFQTNAANTTNAAVEQGKQDVNGANTVTYVDQAKSLAGTVLSTTQGYVAAAGQAVAPADPNAPGILSTIQNTAAATLTTGAQYIGSAHAAVTGADSQAVANDINQTAANAANTAQSNVNAARDTAQPYVDNASSTANQTYNQTSTAARSTADDLTARGQELQQSAGEGVNAYLKLGQDKAAEVTH